MGDFSRVGVEELSEARLDSSYYSNRFLENKRILESCGFPLQRVDSISYLCNCGATPKNVAYSSAGVGLIRTSDVRPNHFLSKGVVKTKDLDISKLRDSVIALPNDLLFTMSGTIGYACVIPDGDESYSFSNTIARVRLPSDSNHDIRFIASFFSSHYGYEQSLRLTSGGIQGHVMPNPFRALGIITPHSLAQKYVGDKVRQAEQLRAWAASTVAKLQKTFEGFYKSLSHYEAFKRISYPIRTDQLLEVLTPASYPPHIEKYFEENSFATLGDLCSKIYTGKTLPTAEGYEGVQQATSRSCSGLFLKQPMNIVERNLNVEPLVQNDILLTNAAHDKNYIGKDVSFNHSDGLILPSAKVLVIRLKKDGIPASYVHSYLMTEAGYTQWQAIVRGISAGIHPSDVARLRVPVPEDRATLEGMTEKADSLYVQAGLAQELSRLLTIAAKTLVEALIEGQLTEDQLIQAQQALDDGDHTLDQAILSKLSSQGYAIEGATPLFSVLDELYHLLEIASKDEQEAED